MPARRCTACKGAFTNPRFRILLKLRIAGGFQTGEEATSSWDRRPPPARVEKDQSVTGGARPNRIGSTRRGQAGTPAVPGRRCLKKETASSVKTRPFFIDLRSGICDLRSITFPFHSCRPYRRASLDLLYPLPEALRPSLRLSASNRQLKQRSAVQYE